MLHEKGKIKKMYLRLLSCFANCTLRVSASLSLAMLLPESVFQRGLAYLDQYVLRIQSYSMAHTKSTSILQNDLALPLAHG